MTHHKTEVRKRLLQASAPFNTTERKSTLALLQAIELIRPEWMVREPKQKVWISPTTYEMRLKSYLQLIMTNKPYGYDRTTPMDIEAIQFFNNQNLKWEFYGARSFYIHVHE